MGGKKAETITAAEAAKRKNCTRGTVSGWMDSRKINSTMVNGVRRVVVDKKFDEILPKHDISYKSINAKLCDMERRIDELHKLFKGFTDVFERLCDRMEVCEQEIKDIDQEVEVERTDIEERVMGFGTVISELQEQCKSVAQHDTEIDDMWKIIKQLATVLLPKE